MVVSGSVTSVGHTDARLRLVLATESRVHLGTYVGRLTRN